MEEVKESGKGVISVKPLLSGCNDEELGSHEERLRGMIIDMARLVKNLDCEKEKVPEVLRVGDEGNYIRVACDQANLAMVSLVEYRKRLTWARGEKEFIEDIGKYSKKGG